MGTFLIIFVRSLNSLQNATMLTPRWPSAGPSGGAGAALLCATCVAESRAERLHRGKGEVGESVVLIVYIITIET